LAEADKKVTESLNSIGKQSETDLVKKYREGGLTDEQISLLLRLAGATNVLARAQLDATQTAKFYSDSISAVQSKIQTLTEEIKEATTFGTNYEKALQDLASRGLSLVDEQAQALIKSAQDLDILEEKAAVLDGIKTASEGLSSSMRGLVENFYELGSASEALKAFNEEVSKKALGLVLDIAFKPVEENIRKSLIMFGEKIGFDFSTPAEKQLTELQTLNRTIDLIRGDVNSLGPFRLAPRLPRLLLVRFLSVQAAFPLTM
jgi:prefoldin subunit 5